MSDVAPVLTERTEGLGWLASTPRGYRYRFAVQGETVEETQANFSAAVERWERPEDERVLLDRALEAFEGQDYPPLSGPALMRDSLLRRRAQLDASAG